MRNRTKVLLTLALVLCALFGYRLATVGERFNADVDEIRNNPLGPLAKKTMVISLPDGRIYPVNYLKENNLVFMGIDGLWWRAFQGAGAPVTLLIQGTSYTGHARVVLDNPRYTEEVFARLRPTVPKWLPDALNGKLVVITLNETK